ncbi:alpha/beta hydrolase [Bacteriovoracaceae bacterium]|nr:alpha/beta hydrolase [Bacteriovoracaceae bacterium]
MPIIDSNYIAPKMMNNGHVQTIYPYFFRKVPGVTFERVRINTRDFDFLDLDINSCGSDECIILTHGLEGDSNSPYIRGMTKYFAALEEKDIIAWNMRSCSGELNKLPQFYHGASIDDLDEVVQYAINRGYKKIRLMGFSLGGNITAFYLGYKGKSIPSQIVASAIFSSPVFLAGSVDKLEKSKIGKLYTESFLNTMRKKVHQKDKIMSLDGIDLEKVDRAKNFYEFDDVVTAPLHGFKDGKDYYKVASSLQYLHQISVPTLLVQSKDDPFLSRECFPLKEAKHNPNLFLEITKSGGHIGFMSYKGGFNYWSESRAHKFFKDKE